MKKKLFLLFLTALIVLTACNSNKSDKNNHLTDSIKESLESTTCANITMGDGRFSYHNHFIYFPAGSGICEYDLLSKESVIIPSKYVIEPFNSSLYVDGTYIYSTYSNQNGLIRMTKDGKKTETIYEGASGYQRLYLTQTHAYYMNYVNGSLFRYNFKTGTEEELCSIHNGYFVEDNTIYTLTQQNDTIHLYKSNMDKIDFQPIQLSFEPIAVLAVDDTLYLSKQGTWEIIMYKDGKETTLPICSFYYQVLGNDLFYCDKFSNSLKSYNLETGKESILFKDYCSSFCILEERYVAISGLNVEYLYDLETKTLDLMYPQGDE